MAERSKFPPVFWVANLIELPERHAYHGVHFRFGICLAHIPAILLMLATKSLSGIVAAMLCIGFAAGIFKPVIAGTKYRNFKPRFPLSCPESTPRHTAWAGLLAVIGGGRAVHGGR